MSINNLITYIQSLNPSLYWALDGANGVTDLSGNNRNGILNGDILIGKVDGPSGATNGATNFDGSNDYISSSYNPFVNGAAQTFAGWAYRDTSEIHDTLVAGSNTNGTPNIVLLRDEVNVNGFWLNASSAGDGDTWAGAWPGNGKWAHWALVFNEATDAATLYINGVFVSTQTHTDSYSSPGNLQIGARGPGVTEPFGGNMAHITVFDRALTPSELQHMVDLMELSIAHVFPDTPQEPIVAAGHRQFALSLPEVPTYLTKVHYQFREDTSGVDFGQPEEEEQWTDLVILDFDHIYTHKDIYHTDEIEHFYQYRYKYTIQEPDKPEQSSNWSEPAYAGKVEKGWNADRFGYDIYTGYDQTKMLLNAQGLFAFATPALNPQMATPIALYSNPKGLATPYTFRGYVFARGLSFWTGKENDVSAFDYDLTQFNPKYESAVRWYDVNDDETVTSNIYNYVGTTPGQITGALWDVNKTQIYDIGKLSLHSFSGVGSYSRIGLISYSDPTDPDEASIIDMQVQSSGTWQIHKTMLFTREAPYPASTDPNWTWDYESDFVSNHTLASEGNISAKAFILPTPGTQNGFVVKAPLSWVDTTYGNAQPFMYLRKDYTGEPTGEGKPDRNVLFRVDKWGGIGTAGGMHIATGYRTPDRSPQATQSVWIDPAVDTHGLIVDAANDAPSSYWMICRLNSGGTIFQINSLGQAAVHSRASNIFGAMTVGVGPGGAQSTLAVGSAPNEITTGSANEDAVVRVQSDQKSLHFGAGLNTLFAAYDLVSATSPAANWAAIRHSAVGKNNYFLAHKNDGSGAINFPDTKNLLVRCGGTAGATVLEINQFLVRFEVGLQMLGLTSQPGTPPPGYAYLFIRDSAGSQNLQVKFDNGVTRIIATD